MKGPITNCWCVYSDCPFLFEIAKSIYLSGYLKHQLGGTAQQFVPLNRYKPILKRAVDKAHLFNRENLRVLELLEAQTQALSALMKKNLEYQQALAYKINAELKIFRGK